jgi:cardiolipin synthase A/B
MTHRGLYFLFVAASLAIGCRNSEQATGDAGAADAGNSGSDAGDGDEVGCEPLAPRTSVPELFIGPTEIVDEVLPVIDSADDTLIVMMYQLSLDAFIDGIVAAADRGAAVRVVLDPDQDNSDAIAAFSAAGVQVKMAAPSFENYHAKVVVADGDLGVVMSGNMNYFTSNSERNYGVVLRDAEDLADIERIFDMDWDGATIGYPTCTRLLISPTNARARLLQHINSAETTLELAVMYITDDQMVLAVKQRHDAGVDVRVLLANPSWIDGNTATAEELRAEGIAVKFISSLHAKLVIADGAAFVGSQNFSWTSLERNREIGVLVDDTAPMARVTTQFETDWANGFE